MPQPSPSPLRSTGSSLSSASHEMRTGPKMIIGPLVFSTLVVGIGHMSDTGTVGRVGGKAMLWFVTASLVSLSLGLILVNLFEPGVGVHKVASGISSGIDAHAMTLDGFIKHVFPDSAVRPMVDNEILQIVVFSILFGIACTAMGERSKLLLDGIEGLSHVILRVTATSCCWRRSRYSAPSR